MSKDALTKKGFYRRTHLVIFKSCGTVISTIVNIHLLNLVFNINNLKVNQSFGNLLITSHQ